MCVFVSVCVKVEIVRGPCTVCAHFVSPHISVIAGQIACSADFILRSFYFQTQQQLVCVGVTVHQYIRWLQLNVAQSSSLFHVKG